MGRRDGDNIVGTPTPNELICSREGSLRVLPTDSLTLGYSKKWCKGHLTNIRRKFTY